VLLNYEYSLRCAHRKLPWLSAKHIAAYVMASRSKLPYVLHLQECLKVFLLSQHRTLLYLCLWSNVNEYLSCQMKFKTNSRNGERSTVLYFIECFSLLTVSMNVRYVLRALKHHICDCITTMPIFFPPPKFLSPHQCLYDSF